MKKNNLLVHQYGDLTILPGYSLKTNGYGNLNIAGSIFGGYDLKIKGKIETKKIRFRRICDFIKQQNL